MPYYAANTNTAVIRQTLNSTHITSALFPTRIAPDLLPTDPVAEDVGPLCDAVVLAAPLILKKLDGSPVGGDCGNTVAVLSVGFAPLGATVADSVTVGTLRGNPYTAHSCAKSMPIRLDTCRRDSLFVPQGTNAFSMGEDGETQLFSTS